MTPICRQIIDHPSAWTPASVKGRADLTRPLTAAELDALDALLEATRDRPPQAIGRADFTHPALEPLLAELRRELMDGRGVILLTGITRDRYSEEDFERIYWGLGTHLGRAAVQSRWGDKLGYVEKAENDPVDRGYRSQRDLVFHTDSYEVVGLMCVRPAATGGESRLASTLAIHNEILKNRPELLEPLYRGYYMALREAQTTSTPVTPMKIPVFCFVGGKVSCTYNRSFMERAADKRGEPLPADMAEALAYFAGLAERDDINIEFLLEPGDILLWHNFTNLHARKAFENSAERKRRLLRLWLTPHEGRPVCSELLERGRAYDRAYEEALTLQAGA